MNRKKRIFHPWYILLMSFLLLFDLVLSKVIFPSPLGPACAKPLRRRQGRGSG
jgi:hypothetical protein